MLNVCLLKTGVYIVEFADIESRAMVMDVGPWYFDNKHVIVKYWSPSISLEREGLANVPV